MASNMRMQNCTDSNEFLYETIAQDIWSQWNLTGENFVYSPWLFSLLGSSIVGLAGVFPLLVISFDKGADLKNGAGAGTLKVLLSFAVGGLLGDVFLHLLPEAWGNEHMKVSTVAASALATATDGEHAEKHYPTPTGLWVLGGFLIFVIVEKMFAFDNGTDSKQEGDQEFSGTSDKNLDYDQTNDAFTKRESEKEMENNNCITLISGHSDNGFRKRCKRSEHEAKDVIKGSNDKKYACNGLANGCVNGLTGERCSSRQGELFNSKEACEGPTSKTSSTLGYTCVNTSASQLKIMPKLTNSYDQIKKTGSAKRALGAFENHECINRTTTTASRTAAATSAKPISGSNNGKYNVTGYLNLMANVIDNFTHGLAVGGSFLVSFRLGALTTFAILVHEIPHEVGDFAILLRSGFSRWDAARAQLLTASGGIFGALAAVFFSAGGVAAKTTWILPFTAGGFLHIGMVTILPELLQESNTRESLKQLGALLLGIAVMAILTVLCD